MVQSELPTSTDVGANVGWRIDDPIIRLREWGSERVHGLPDQPIEWIVGSAPSCQLQLQDRQISREHARLVPYRAGWKIYDLKSKNGLWRDGVRRLDFALTPGLEIGIGGRRLIAESRHTITLRALVCRYLGWAAERQDDVDKALRSLREWAAQRSSLVLTGDGELVSVARRLHTFTLGADAPFVEASLPGNEGIAPPRPEHGTLWLRADALPSNIAAVVSSLHTADNRTRVIVGARDAEEAAAASVVLGNVAILALPPLSSRPGEVERIVQESADDAAQRLGAPAPGFTMNDLDRLSMLTFGNLAEIEETVRRLVALRTWGVSGGAVRLGLSHVSLSRWARRRKLTT